MARAKTTLINILAGLVRADRGSVRVMGHDVIADYRESRRALGVVPQDWCSIPFLACAKPCACVGLLRPEAQRCLDRRGHAAPGPDRQGRRQHALALRRMKRRVLVGAGAGAQAAGDRAGRNRPRVWTWNCARACGSSVRGLNRDGHTIVLTTHYLEEAEALCARIAMLKQGRIVALDTTSNLVNRRDGLYLKLRISGAALPAALAARVRD